MTERITPNDLYELRSLLAKLRDQPGTSDWAHVQINTVICLTSIVLDEQQAARSRSI